ncbi:MULTISPECIES: helix-turn-helix domain-containing protein [unclassified Microbacterium]|uniref:helix-turn-helix domain-containing protein n=1 Tax=Microbacterium sp. NPDC087665 TaxID=3364194 RepID=UPI00380F93ED
MSERVPRKPPAALVDQWPDTPTSDPAGEAVRRFVVNLREALGDRSVRAVARDAGLDERTIRHVMAGSVWPDLLTVSRLEHVLGVNLYPGAN